MASLNTTLHQPSLSVGTKLYSGLKLQSPSLCAIGGPNLTAEFYGRVNRSLCCSGSDNLSMSLSAVSLFVSFFSSLKKILHSVAPFIIGGSIFDVLSFAIAVVYVIGFLRNRSINHKPSRAAVRMMPIGTPRVPYRTPGEGTWQWVDLWNALYRERVIFIGQNIDEEFSNQILATMLYLDTIDDSKKIFLYINGPGGDLTPSLAIYDTMQSLKSPVATHCVGYAYNLAGFLLAAGEKGHRTAMPLSRIALQSPAGAARGQADDIRNEANELLRIKDYLYSELAKKTGQPVEKINKDLSRMKRFTAQEALDYGLIDRIIRPPLVDADVHPRDSSAGLG